MILHVACCYLWLFSLYINIKIGKKLLHVRLASDHLYGKGVYDGICFVLSFIPRDIFDEIIESVSEGFFTYF